MKLGFQQQNIRLFLLFILFGIISNIRRNKLDPTLASNYPSLEQQIKAPFLKEFRVNDQLIISGSIENQLISVDTVIKSGDKIDIKIKNAKFQQMGFSASLKFYDKNGKVKNITTDYAKWTCEGFIPARFSSQTFNIEDISTIGKSIDKESANEEYCCSVVIPENTPLIQKFVVDDYLTEIKVNGESLKIYDDKLLKNKVPFSFILNSKDKLDIKIRNNGELIGLAAELKYYDLNGNIKTFNTEYAGWTCDGSVGIKHIRSIFFKGEFCGITKKKGNVVTGEVYWCSVTVPIQEPLQQKFTVDDHLTNIKINGKSLLLQTINLNENIPFTYPINAGDTIDITIKNDKGSMWLSGTIKYYNSKGEIKTLSTNYLGWTCNDKTAVKIGNGFNNIMKISEKNANANVNTEYVCSVKIPDIEPLTQKLKVNNYINSIKVNDEILNIQRIKDNQEIPFTWTLNAGDKVDFSIENEAKGLMGLCGKLQYYDLNGNIKTVSTDYADWSCSGITPVRSNQKDVTFDNIKTIATKSIYSEYHEAYTCSLIIPNKEPLVQKIRAIDIFINMKVNNQIIKLESFKKNENIPFTYVLNSGDKIDITIKNISGQMGLSAKLQYYDQNENVQIFTTENNGWTCDGDVPVIYENKSYSADGVKFIGKTNQNTYDNEKYTCSVTIP